MATIKVHLRKDIDRSYDIIIESGLAKKLPMLLKKKRWGEKYAIISDETISKLYGRNLQKVLQKAGIRSELFTFPDGDTNKNIKSTVKILDEMLDKKFDRNDAIIALGGGVPGDLAGFVAAIFMRGIPYIHVPTSLLAMVDSSIGGKTGVNLSAGKNLAGSIYQPKIVIIDPDYLKKLPESELLCGMSETLKYGIILSPTLFEYIEKNPDNLLKRTPQFLNKIITQSCKLKATVIEKDEYESGLRMILNYGHTIGHALEKLTSYKMNHGQAIAIGMKLVNSMCVKKNLQPESEKKRINNLINILNLAQCKEEKVVHPKNADKLWEIMKSDKKALHGIIRFIIVPTIGTTEIYDKFTKKDLSHALLNYDRD